MARKPVTWPVVMTERKYRGLVDRYCGICLDCGAIRHGDTEPDAEGYPCGRCKAPRVRGIENAMMAGNVEIAS